MKLRVITKISIASAIVCGILFGVSVAPLLAAAAMAVFTLICLLICLVILIAGCFVWLFTVGKTNIFGSGIKVANFGMNTFTYINSVTEFSFTYFTPIVGWVAFGVGIVGIVLCIIALATAGKAVPQAEEVHAADVPATAEEVPQTVSDGKRGKLKRKKKRTDKGACVGALVACIVLTALALVAVIAAAKILAAM